MTDAFDLVRSLYDAINRDDLDAVTARYAPDASLERVVVDRERVDGRDAIREAYAAEFAAWRGAFEGGRRLRVRTVGGIETGWGWVHAEWVQMLVAPDGGARLSRAGHSHFLLEDGLIRRHRSVVTADGDEVAQLVDGEAPRGETRRYPSRPITGVGAVVVRDGAVLLVRRKHEPLAGQWSLPGGTLELGETLEAGAAREILEETGLAVEVGPVVEVFDRILLDAQGKVRYHFVLIDYLCRPFDGEPRAGSDVDAVAFVRPEDLPQYRLTGKASDVIRRGLAVAKENGWLFTTGS